MIGKESKNDRAPARGEVGTENPGGASEIQALASQPAYLQR
jgi:hypothetical protein